MTLLDILLVRFQQLPYFGIQTILDREFFDNGMIDLIDERLAISDDRHLPLLLQPGDKRFRDVANAFFR
jgi:hypothetical protein